MAFPRDVYYAAIDYPKDILAKGAFEKGEFGKGNFEAGVVKGNLEGNFEGDFGKGSFGERRHFGA